MINYESFKTLYSDTFSDSEEIQVGNYRGLYHKNVTPLFKFEYFDLFIEGLGFIHIICRDSFKEEILEQTVEAFESFKIKKYKKDNLYVYKACQLKDFDSIAIAPPDIAEVYEASSTELSKYGYWVFPIHGIEFQDGFSKKQFWHQIRRKDDWRVTVVDWERRISKN